MKKMYTVIKYVSAETADEAVRLSKKTPVHEVNIFSQWWEKQGYQFNEPKSQIGFKKA